MNETIEDIEIKCIDCKKVNCTCDEDFENYSDALFMDELLLNQ